MKKQNLAILILGFGLTFGANAYTGDTIVSLPLTSLGDEGSYISDCHGTCAPVEVSFVCDKKSGSYINYVRPQRWDVFRAEKYKVFFHSYKQCDELVKQAETAIQTNRHVWITLSLSSSGSWFVKSHIKECQE